MGVEKSSIKKTYKKLKDELQLELGPPEPVEYVGYICQTLKLPESVQKESTRLLEETATVGGNPIGTAAASVYEISTEQSEDVTFREIAKATSLTKETVWRHAEKLRSANSN
jgi:transcription initiation factor TFIIIB Brf1 subunit/transcription initiation factor TFIIB